MDTKTQKSELTLAAIVGAGIDIAGSEGLQAITLQAVADRIGLSKSGVFSRIGSREALQKAVIEEFGRRFIAEVFAPAMQKPKGLPRLDDIVQRWIVRMRDVEVHHGCIYTAGAFELDDCEGALRDVLLNEVTRWRAALRRTVVWRLSICSRIPNPSNWWARFATWPWGYCTMPDFCAIRVPPNVPRPPGCACARATRTEFVEST